MKKLVAFLFFMQALLVCAQMHKTENVIIVTLDGMRWQEVFGGVDLAILKDKRFTHDSVEIAKLRWSDNIKERRIIPFFLEHYCVRGTVIWRQEHGKRDQ